jgi:hypothetical protein
MKCLQELQPRLVPEARLDVLVEVRDISREPGIFCYGTGICYGITLVLYCTNNNRLLHALLRTSLKINKRIRIHESVSSCQSPYRRKNKCRYVDCCI